MKIFFFTTVFAPSVGGIERLAEMLCRAFVAQGHEVRLVTLTPGDGDFPFPVIRCPSLGQMHSLLQWCDVHVQANVALKYVALMYAAGRKGIWQHNTTYNRDDFSLSKLGRLKRWLARTQAGIAVSPYVGGALGCKTVIPNAFDDSVFQTTTPWAQKPRDLVFLGRLVSQKGCDVLIKALAELHRQGINPCLTVIGQGPDSAKLKELAATERLTDHVEFVGVKRGAGLADLLNKHRVIVVPSRYEEAFGIVALEGLACGCLPIVSERGGLKDAIGPHGFAVKNGDVTSLAHTLAEILTDPDAASARLDGVSVHLAQHTIGVIAERYLEVFRNNIEARNQSGRLSLGSAQ